MSNKDDIARARVMIDYHRSVAESALADSSDVADDPGHSTRQLLRELARLDMAVAHFKFYLSRLIDERGTDTTQYPETSRETPAAKRTV